MNIIRVESNTEVLQPQIVKQKVETNFELTDYNFEQID